MNGETKKVYLAILNYGNLRREMQTTVIPAMNKTPGVELVWENPSKTWANPISSNRCKIVKRFLETDCDFLLMIDDDVVPLHNPCEMVHADIDVIGSPALVRAAGQIMCWTAYIPHSDGHGYSAVDLDSFDDMFDMLEVAIVGTGCILIKRKVLENIKAPFHSEFDDDGIQTYGTDFAFCRRATDAGFKVYTTIHRRCEHFKTIGFNDISAWDSINYFCRDNAKYGIPWGDYSVTQKDWSFIKDKVETLGCKKILEFGSGLSSLLLSETCEVISYETDPEWADKIRKLKKDGINAITGLPYNNLTIKLWDGHTVPEDLQTYMDIAKSVKGKSFDLCFVDGPKSRMKGGVGREVATAIAAQVSDNVLVHDAGRSEEEGYQKAYLRGIFKLVRKSGNHLIRLHYWKRRPKPVTLEDVKRDLKAKKDNASD